MKLNNKGVEGRLRIGKLKEDQLKKLFDKTGWATREQDIFEHWDFSIHLKIDVKGMKKTNRYDESTNENIHWLEIKNVNGEEGWLYGEADYFAFETELYWIIVEKVVLQEWVAKNIQKEWVDTPTKYKLYRRRTGQDIITLVSTHDLYFLSETVIRKKEDL
tara:strand:+ start:1701 stop:2183 length:483 start_codon:yes stop_codon:yes gene_type:complete